jgi:hypothetical protein
MFPGRKPCRSASPSPGRVGRACEPGLLPGKRRRRGQEEQAVAAAAAAARCGWQHGDPGGAGGARQATGKGLSCCGRCWSHPHRPSNRCLGGPPGSAPKNGPSPGCACAGRWRLYASSMAGRRLGLPHGPRLYGFFLKKNRGDGDGARQGKRQKARALGLHKRGRRGTASAQRERHTSCTWADSAGAEGKRPTTRALGQKWSTRRSAEMEELFWRNLFCFRDPW